MGKVLKFFSKSTKKIQEWDLTSKKLWSTFGVSSNFAIIPKHFGLERDFNTRIVLARRFQQSDKLALTSGPSGKHFFAFYQEMLGIGRKSLSKIMIFLFQENK